MLSQQKYQEQYEGDFDFFGGARCGISLCCIDFYELCWLPIIRYVIPEYTESMYELSDETGVLLCPNCIANKLSATK